MTLVPRQGPPIPEQLRFLGVATPPEAPRHRFIVFGCHGGTVTCPPLGLHSTGLEAAWPPEPRAGVRNERPAGGDITPSAAPSCRHPGLLPGQCPHTKGPWGALLRGTGDAPTWGALDPTLAGGRVGDPWAEWRRRQRRADGLAAGDLGVSPGAGARALPGAMRWRGSTGHGGPAGSRRTAGWAGPVRTLTDSGEEEV